MSKKKKKKKHRKEIRSYTVGENMPEIKPMFKPKHTRKALKKLNNAIRAFTKSLAKRKSELDALSKVPIAEIRIKFDDPDKILFAKRKGKKKKRFVSGNIEIENNIVLGAWKYDVKVNPKSKAMQVLEPKKKKKRN